MIRSIVLLLTAVTCTVWFYFAMNPWLEIDLTENTLDSEIEYIESQTGIDPGFSVIWLHGLGADGSDFETIPPQLGIASDIAVRFIFPHAPMRPITVNGGRVMRGWYDIVDLPIDSDQPRTADRAGLEASTDIVQQLIEQENQRGIPTSRIFLAGFSQGGAVALFAGLRMQEKPAGIIALSTYVADADTLESERSDISRSVPIFFGHGTEDPLIPLSAATESKILLESLGYPVEWHTYEMPHSVHPLEIQQIGAFINKVSANIGN